MSRRTAESQKAIREAWEKEQELVKEGKGTRNWTPEQQKDILEKGKAYDENGKAFEGQHMKSAEQYPEYQRNPGNIQFLTREEHLEAHGGSWQNPTNWYFNPITKEKIDFGDGPFVSCEVISLAEPVIEPSVENNTVEPSVEPNTTDAVNKDLNKGPIQEKKITKSEEHIKESLPVDAPVHKGIGAKIAKAVEAVTNFSNKHPIATEIAKAVVTIGAGVVTDRVVNGGGKKKSTNVKITKKCPSVKKAVNSDTIKNVADTVADVAAGTHESPIEHMVKAHGQHCNTKNSRIYKEKAPYPRGGKKV